MCAPCAKKVNPHEACGISRSIIVKSIRDFRVSTFWHQVVDFRANFDIISWGSSEELAHLDKSRNLSNLFDIVKYLHPLLFQNPFHLLFGLKRSTQLQGKPPVLIVFQQISKDFGKNLNPYLFILHQKLVKCLGHLSNIQKVVEIQGTKNFSHDFLKSRSRIAIYKKFQVHDKSSENQSLLSSN